jgi:beta-galactosidase
MQISFGNDKRNYTWNSPRKQIGDPLMQRRTFLKTAGSLVAATALPTAAHAAAPASSRVILPMNRNWRYHPAKVSGAEMPSFDDSAFATVVIPHSNIMLPWHNFDDKLYEFVSTYRRRFRLPPEARGKRVFVDFEGAMTASTVWINGTPLGEYKGGFTPFSFDLTPHLHPDAENVLVVQLDSTERPDIPPFGFEIDYAGVPGQPARAAEGCAHAEPLARRDLLPRG